VRIDLQPIAQGLGSPVLLLPAPDKSSRLFVVDQQGHVRIVENNALRPEPFLDVTGRLVKLIKEFDERGLLGLAFDPGFNDAQSPGKGRLFTYTSEPASRAADFPIIHGKIPPDHQSVIASWRVSATDPNRVDVGTRKEVMRIDEPQFNHNAGMIGFGPDGLLYIATGDGGAGNDLGPGHNPEIGNAQDKNVVLGKMLRIDVNGNDSTNGAYGIPKDNPFASGGGAREIFAIGLRNPYRFSFDGPSLLVGDVGQNKLEMLYRVERGGNYGWRLKEGTFKFNKNGTIEAPTDLPAGLTDPILQYDHDEGISIVGGYVYHGSALPALAGKYIFGDYRSGTKTSTGRIFVGDLNTREIRELKVGKEGRDPGFLVKGFGQDLAGELYVTGSAEPGPAGIGGVVYKIVGLPVP
jgi:glucose/arabinose dehydrogenase